MENFKNLSFKKSFAPALMLSLLAGLLGLPGCSKSTDGQATGDASAAAAASGASSAQTAYTPPSAEQLYQLVAPIALFPDQLVAQVLAGSTYPDQITAANDWLAQNTGLQGTALQTAANQQTWDVSVKALTAFPVVLKQMAGNLQWTTSLGEAYANDPSDVMNAIQVMRQRASASGNLKTSQQLKIVSVASAQAAPPPDYTSAEDTQALYEGPPIVQPPTQTIVIEPAQPEVVYVPTYNPAVVYGEPLPLYPGYVYRPVSEYVPGPVITTGVISFGVGIVIGAAISNHYDWGWHSWGMNWGGPRGNGGERDTGWRRPAVVYNHSTYVTKSTTVVNRITNNYSVVNNRNTVNNNRSVVNNAAAPGSSRMAAQDTHGGQMSMPHFGPNDAKPGPHPMAAPTPRELPAAENRRPAIAAEARQAPGHEPGYDGRQHAQPAPRPAPSGMDHEPAQGAGRAPARMPEHAAPHPAPRANTVRQAPRPAAPAPREARPAQMPARPAQPRPAAPPHHSPAPNHPAPRPAAKHGAEDHGNKQHPDH